MIFFSLSLIFTILFFYYHNYFFLVLIGFFLFVFIYRNKSSKGILISFISVLLIFVTIYFNYFNFNKIDLNSNEFIVTEDFNNYVILKNKNNKFIYYDKNTLNKGNRVKIEGKVSLLDFDNDFNKYLKTQRIYYRINGRVTYSDHNLSLNQKIINKLLINKSKKDASLLRLILFNQKDENNSYFYNLFNTFSLSFLIVISGFHINLLFKLLDKFKIIKYPIVLGYLFLLDGAISSLKAFIYIVLKKINKKFNLYLNNCDLLSLILIAILFTNPSYLFNLGFIFTFLFSFSIDLITNVLNKKSLLVSFIKRSVIYLIGLPLVLLNNYQVNLFSYPLTMIFTLPASILFVISLLSLCFNNLSSVFNFYINLLDKTLSYLSLNSIKIVFGKPSMIVISLLYLSIVLFLYLYENKFKIRSYLSLLMYPLILSFQYALPYMDNREMVYFIDVGQGDCSALKIRNSKSVVLIDTGGNIHKDIAKDKVIPFLLKEGIDCVDLVIISHDDYDHCGALKSLQMNFKVNRVIDNSLFESVLIGNKEFKNLNVNPNRDNNGSNVLYGEYGGINYLFTGDIFKEIEDKIIIENPNLDVDVLKVSHHGSSSSSSELFISNLKPEIGIISVGKFNNYGHPSKETIDRLNKYKVKIYKTSSNGNLKIYKDRFTNLIVIEKQKDML